MTRAFVSHEKHKDQSSESEKFHVNSAPGYPASERPTREWWSAPTKKARCPKGETVNGVFTPSDATPETKAAMLRAAEGVYERAREGLRTGLNPKTAPKLTDLNRWN